MYKKPWVVVFKGGERVTVHCHSTIQAAGEAIKIKTVNDIMAGKKGRPIADYIVKGKT